jgi:hypothetical protein
MRSAAEGGTVDRDTTRKEHDMANVKRTLLITAAAVATTAAFASATTQSARAEGVTPEALVAAGWDCFQTPPFIVPPRIVCANPGLGRPFPGNPDPVPAYTVPTFDLAGTYLGKVHLIRADLYQGQPCAGSGDQYVFRSAIGYYECLRI